MKIHPKNVKTLVIAAVITVEQATTLDVLCWKYPPPPLFMLAIPMQSMANNYYNNIEQVEGGIFYFQHFSPGLQFDATSNKPFYSLGKHRSLAVYVRSIRTHLQFCLFMCLVSYVHLFCFWTELVDESPFDPECKKLRELLKNYFLMPLFRE